MKSGPRSPGHNVFSKCLLRTISMQGLTLTAITAAKKCCKFENFREGFIFVKL